MKIIGVSAEVTSDEESFWMHVATGDGQQQRVPLIAEQFELFSDFIRIKPSAPQHIQTYQQPQQPQQPQQQQVQPQYQDDVFARPVLSQQQTQLARSSRQQTSSGLEQMVDVLKQQTTVVSHVADDEGAPVDFGEIPLRGGLGNVPQI